MTGDYKKAKRGIRFALFFTAVLWAIEGFEDMTSTNLESLGILPRTLKGSIGILTGPLVHGDIFHLISNTFPILILVIGIFYFYDKIASTVFFLIYFMTGFWVWIAARDAYHIGASGLVYGLISFLLFSGFLRRELKTLAVSFAVLILYGSNMFYGLLPVNESISWESHILGAVAGLFCAIYFRPVKQQKIILRESKNANIPPLLKSNYFTYLNPDRMEYDYKEDLTNNKYNYTIDESSNTFKGE